METSAGLPNEERLRKIINISPQSVCCRNDIEIEYHLFISCAFSIIVWSKAYHLKLSQLTLQIILHSFIGFGVIQKGTVL